MLLAWRGNEKYAKNEEHAGGGGGKGRRATMFAMCVWCDTNGLEYTIRSDVYWFGVKKYTLDKIPQTNDNKHTHIYSTIYLHYFVFNVSISLSVSLSLSLSVSLLWLSLAKAPRYVPVGAFIYPCDLFAFGTNDLGNGTTPITERNSVGRPP